MQVTVGCTYGSDSRDEYRIFVWKLFDEYPLEKQEGHKGCEFKIHIKICCKSGELIVYTDFVFDDIELSVSGNKDCFQNMLEKRK